MPPRLSNLTYLLALVMLVAFSRSLWLRLIFPAWVLGQRLHLGHQSASQGGVMITNVELTIILRAVLAALLGFLIGWERKALGAPILARATALAATTAATLVALTESFYPDETPRIVAGIVTGIGFLGAGAILRSSTGEVSGHTTAASLWAMSAIGMAVGSGHELLGFLLAAVLYTIIAISGWPLLTRLTQVWAQKQAETVRKGGSDGDGDVEKQ